MSAGRHDDHEHEAGEHAHDDLRYLGDGGEPAVFAARGDVSFAPAQTDAEVKAAVSAFLSALADELAAAGCTLVGHIKGHLGGAGQGPLAFSLTSLTGEPRWVGSLREPVARLEVTLNVIVFGVSDSIVSDAVPRCWSANVVAPTLWR